MIFLSMNETILNYKFLMDINCHNMFIELYF